MTPWRVLFGHLKRSWFRGVLTSGGVALAVFLLCTLRTVTTSFDSVVQGAGGNRLVVSSAVSLFVFLPQKLETDLRGTPGVEDVTHWTWFGGVYIDEKNMFARFATDPRSLRRVYGDQSKGREDLVLSPAAWESFISQKASCIVGQGLVRDYGFAVGDTIELEGNIFPGDWSFDVVGVYEAGSSQMDEQTMFFHWDYLDEASGRPGLVSTYTVQLSPGTDLAAVSREIDARYESSDHRTRTLTEAAFNQMFVSMWGNVPALLALIGGAVLFAAFMIALNTMLLNGEERRLEVGVLKALGFPSRSVALLFLGEGVSLCALGGVVGAVAAHLVFNVMGVPALAKFFPNFEILPETILTGIGIAFAVGLVSGIVPAVVAVKTPVVSALERR